MKEHMYIEELTGAIDQVERAAHYAATAPERDLLLYSQAVLIGLLAIAVAREDDDPSEVREG